VHKKFFVKDFWGRPQPWDIIFNAYFAGGIYKLLAMPFLWITSLTMIISCMKTMHPNGHPDSSGKQLVFGQVYISDMKLTRKLCDYIIKRNKLFGSWVAVINEYYKEPKHPTRLLIKKLTND
jgi:hypothetical protein